MNAETCLLQAKALMLAANSSPVKQIGGPLRRRAREWERAAGDLDSAAELGLDVELALAGTVTPGARLVVAGAECSVIRVLTAGGQLTLHVTDEAYGTPSYVNLVGGPTAPVVILA